MAEFQDLHAPRTPEPVDKSGELEQSDEQKELVKKIDKLFNLAKSHRERYDYKWIDFYRLFRGKQWFEKRPTYRHSEVVNLIFQTIQSNVPLQTEARPKIEFLPTNPEDREFSDILNELMDADWDKYDWSSQLLEIIYDANIYGSGLNCLYFDKEAEYGMGAMIFKSEDPFQQFPDPFSKDVNLESDYFIHAEPIPTEKLKIKYPDQAEYIKPDIQDFTAQSKTEMEKTRWISPTDRQLHREGEYSQHLENQDKTLVFTAFLKPQDIEEVQEESKDPGSGQVSMSFVQKKKWPNGRRVVICNKRVMEDGPNPYDHGEFPYSKCDLYKLPREFWGIGEIEQLESPQRVFNKLMSFSLDVLTLMGNPIWVVDNASGVEVRKLTNQPGLIVTKNPNTEVRREEGVQLQPFVLDLVDRFKSYVDAISGSQEVSRGVRPEGITAAAAIEDLQDAAKTRIRQKMRNLDSFLRNVGRQYACNVLQFYTAPRVFRLTNQDGSNKYFKFHVENRADEMGKPVKVGIVRDFAESASGQLMPQEAREIVIRGNFDVKVNTGSALPFSKVEKENKLLAYFDRGIIDAEELFKQTDYPNYEAVLERQRALAAQQAQMQPPPKGA